MTEVVSTSGLGPVYSIQAKETLMGELDDHLGRYLDLNSDINPSTDEPYDSADVERLLQGTIFVTTTQQFYKDLESKESVGDEDATEAPADSDPKLSVSDPLNWFGILVPPALRASQRSFRNATTETIPLLANLSNELKSMEIEIRRTRKRISKLG
ncbi:MAG: hypothetical protein Q9226_001502 [Calogaya cf. arnoldii]